MKIKSWPFQGPILIQEKGEIDEGFLIDKWCCLGSYKGEDEGSRAIDHQYQFDYDTYKILVRYLYNGKNLSKIKVLRDSPSRKIC